MRVQPRALSASDQPWHRRSRSRLPSTWRPRAPSLSKRDPGHARRVRIPRRSTVHARDARYFGRSYGVSARAERACDTISKTGARRMPNVVLLNDLRCDGSGHGGCQAGCRIYWNEARLSRGPDDVPTDARADPAYEKLRQLAVANTRPMQDSTVLPESTAVRRRSSCTLVSPSDGGACGRFSVKSRAGTYRSGCSPR